MHILVQIWNENLEQKCIWEANANRWCWSPSITFLDEELNIRVQKELRKNENYSKHTEYYHEIVERILSKQLDIPFVEECRKLFTKQKKLKKNGKVFGSSLQNYQLARIQPLVITIRDQIESEGIFRKPGSRQRQRDLRDQLDKGDALPSVINVNDAADLLKAFLRELPNPLLPSEHFGTHISIADMKTCEGKEIFFILNSPKTQFRSRG